MEFLKKFFTVSLILLTLDLYLPRLTFAQQAKPYYTAFKGSDNISKTSPDIVATPEKDIPVDAGKSLAWTFVGILAVAGIIALAGGGGGGDDNGTKTHGKINVTW